VNNLKNRAISALEQRLNVKISYDDFYFSSWDEVKIRGLELRESGFKRNNILVSAEDVKVSVRISNLLFKKLDNFKFLRSISINDFHINFFSNSSIINSFSLAMNNKIDYFSPTRSKEKGIKLNFNKLNLECKKGKLNYYTYDVQEFNLPLASVSLDGFSFYLDKFEGVFKLNGRSELFRSLNGFSANFGIDGLINFKEKSLDVGVVFDRISLLGESVPDVRFLVDYRDSRLKIDSAIFKQLLYLEGSYRNGETGAFRVKINPDSTFFMNFLENRKALKSIFDLGKRYSFTGEINLFLLKNDFKLGARMNVRGNGRSVVDMRILANSGYLDIQRIKLAGKKSLFMGKGRWFFKRRLPNLNLNLKNFFAAGSEISGNFNLQYRNKDRYFISLNNAIYNKAYLGSLSSSLIFDEDGLRFDSHGYNRFLNFKGFLDDENDMHIELALNGFNLAPIAKLAKLGSLRGAILSGRMHLNIMDNEVESEGSLRGFNFFGSRNSFQLSYLYSENNLRIKRAFLSSPTLSFTGDIKIGPEEVFAKLNLFLAGVNYPLQGYLKFDRNNKLSVNIRNWFSLSGSLTPNPSFKASFRGLPVMVSSMRFNLYGKALLGYKSSLFQVNGSISAISGGMLKNYLRQIRVVFRSQGSRFNFKNILLEFPNRKINGFGNFVLGKNDNRFNLSFDKTIDLYLKYRSGQILSKIVFNKFDIKNLLKTDLQGDLVGSLVLSGFVPDVEMAGNLKLVNGLLNKKKVGFGFNLKSVKNGFAISKGNFNLANDKISVNRGLVKLKKGKVDYFSLVGKLSIPSMLGVKSNYKMQGKIALNDFSCDMQYSNLLLNGNVVGNLKSHLLFSKGVLRVFRKGKSGITGYLDFKNSDFSFSFFDNNVIRLTGAGNIGKKDLDIFLQSDNLSLSYLKLFSGVFSEAKGLGKMRLKINGTLNAIKLNGYLEFNNGRLKTSIFQKDIEKFKLRINFIGNKIRLIKLYGKIGKGEIFASGSSFFRKDNIEDLNVRFRTDRKEGVKVGFDAGDLKAKGKVFVDVVIKGSLSSPKIIGRLAVSDNDISYMEDSGPSKDSYVKHIDWHLDITAMTSVRYYYTIVNVVLKPGTGLKLRGRVWDPDFNVKGKIEIERGTFDYINHEFKIVSPTYLDFRKSPRVYDAVLNFKGKTVVKDVQGNNVNIYILYAGVLGIDDLKPKFYSEPSFSEDKIQQMLGVKLESDGGDNKEQENIILESTDLISMLGLSTLVSKRVKSLLGLDVFTIRTSILRHLIEKDSLDNLDPEREMSVLRGTEFTIGKYLTSFIFIEYTLSLQSAANIVSELIPTHKIGIDFSFNLLNVGYKFKSTEESDFSDYEHSIEVNFRKKF